MAVRSPRAATTDLVPAHLSNHVYPSDRRALLLASSVLTGGTLRSLAAAAGMITVAGISPAVAECYSTATGFAGTNCAAIAPTGVQSLIIGNQATGTGFGPTA